MTPEAPDPRAKRTDRLDSQIQQVLMELLQREMKDPRLGFATVTQVEISRDLGHVTAWISILGSEEERTASMAALADATPWLRRKLGERIRLRHVPVLAIRRDESIERGDRVLSLLNDLAEEGRNDE
jgi:ribosome-binding factor A